MFDDVSGQQTDPVLSRALNDWLRALRSERRLATATLSAYASDLRLFIAYLCGHVGGQLTLANLADLRAGDLRGFLASRRSKGLSARSMARELAAIRSFIRFLGKAGLADLSGLTIIRAPRLAKTLPRPLPIQASRAIVASDLHEESSTQPWIAARDAAVLSLLYGCGLRISEALSIIGRDEVQISQTLRVTGKGSKTRLVPLLPVVREAVASYLALCPYACSPNEPIFRGARGGPLKAKLIQNKVAQLRGALGLNDSATPHALRHSFASHLLQRGGDLRAIQELLGHASLSSTQIYTAIDTGHLLTSYENAHPRARRR